MIYIKKVVLIVVAIIILVIASFAIYNAYFTNAAEERKVKEYVKEKYGYNVEIKSLSRAGFNADYEFLVFPENHKDLQFEVVLDSYTDAITDDYAYAIEADKAFHQLEKVIPAIEQLGFQGPDYFDGEIRVDYWAEKKMHNLYLYSVTPLEMATFEDQELDRFFELQRIIQQSGADITAVSVTDMREPADSKSVSFNMNAVKSVNTKEALFTQIKRGSWELASFDENKKWEAEKAKIENDRFTFQSEYDDYWFNCRETNEKGECTNIFVTIYFNENSLTQSNTYLEQDLDAIFTLFEKTMTPRAAIEYNFIEKGSDDSVRFLDKEIERYESTAQFIRQNFK